jgi:anthranilate/para-aminobenzoate synthase component I
VISSLPARTLHPFRVPLQSRLPPEEALLWLRDTDRPFALHGDWLGGVTLLGSDPLAVAAADDDPFELLDAPPRVGHGGAMVGGGWVGWLGYGLSRRLEQLPPDPPAPVVRPEFSLAFYDHVLLHDGARWWFEALWSPERADLLRARLTEWQDRLGRAPGQRPNAYRVTGFEIGRNGAAGHRFAVADARRRIVEGELLQVNLCLRLEAGFAGDPVDLLAGAIPGARPRFGALVAGVVSLSPERFLRREGRLVQTEPIKGTSARVGSPERQQAALEELLASTKDAAELVMIVDLMRNDLGRVCSYGSVGAELPRAEAHAGVWHTVSTVSGRLREGVGDGELLRATFPPGSVTGAPKVQAMKVIAALEATRREAYTGAIGIASPVAGLDLSVAIRTFELDRGRIWLGAGGGIVAGSDPERELREALAKAAGPIAAIGGRIMPRPRTLPLSRHRIEQALETGPRPDPAEGVFETVLIQRGRLVALSEHLERLASSLEELYGACLPQDVTDRIERLPVIEHARLRILADPDGAVELALSPQTRSAGAPARLIPYLLPGGLGPHKWRDRRLLDALVARAPGTVPLLIDTDGSALEAGHANVWIVEGESLITPPADGRILPGVTRASLLRRERTAREAPVGIGRLLRAESVFLSSSIGGQRSARLAGGSVLEDRDQLGERLGGLGERVDLLV